MTITLPDVSVLIPAKNESGNLAALLDAVEQALEGQAFEVIVVDDGSTDDTWPMLMRYQADHAWLRPLHHAKSAGQSTSVWQAAWAARGTWLATLDGDGQNDPADLPAMLDIIKARSLALLAGHRTHRQDDQIKLLSSRIANAVRSWLLKDETPDTGCGIKVMQRDAFLRLPYFNHMHRFLPALMRAQGHDIDSHPVRHHPRGTGASNYGTLDRLRAGLLDLLGVAWLVHRSRLPAPLETHGQQRTGDTVEAGHQPPPPHTQVPS